MITTSRPIALVLGLSLVAGSAGAAEYNKRPHMPPDGRVKINNTRAKIFVVQDQVEQKEERANQEADFCRDTDNGVVIDRSNPRREVIIATQDIVNLGGRLDLRAGCR